MATLKELRNRIKGVQSTQKITKAMKMVAAAKLRKAQEAMMRARPYAAKVAEMMDHLITDEDRSANPFIAEREVKKVCVVPVTSDRGLCGAFNHNINRETERFIEDELKANGTEFVVYPVGRKCYDFSRKAGYEMYGSKINIFNSLQFEDGLSAINELKHGYLNEDFDKVIIISNHFVNVASQKVVIDQYLPVKVDDAEEEAHEDVDYIYEPDRKHIFDTLLPKHLVTFFWKTLLESNAAEFGARMTAMDNATTNAEDMIRDLTVKYNKERQAAITTEIVEVVSGANALRKG